MEDSGEISLLFIVYSLWFMENSGEIRCTTISQSVGRSQGTALRKQLITDY